MPKLRDIVILLSIVAVVLFLIHFLVFWTLFRLTNYSGAVFALALSGGIIASFYAMFGIFRFVIDGLWEKFYFTVNLWLGLLALCFLFCILHHFFSIFITISKSYSLAFILGGGTLSFIYGLINAASICIHKVEVKAPGLYRPVTIAHLSDLHLGVFYQKGFVDKLVQIILEQAPDMVVITGDIADGNMKITADMLSPFQKLPMKIFYVTGNHEGYAGLDYVLSIVHKTNIIHLSNQTTEYRGVNLIGIDFAETKGHLLQELAKINVEPDKPNVLLYHIPMVKAEYLENCNISLFLSGHTHGGQFPPFQLLAYLGNEYLAGFYSSKSGKCKVFVSMGVGCAGPPMRIFSRSVIGFITLKA